MKKKYGDKIREAIYQQELKPVHRSIFTNEIQNILYEAIDQRREEIIMEVGECLPKVQKIIKKDWLGLDYTLGDVKYREHTYRLLVLDILNKLKKTL